jgi:hypothetical protein
VLLLHTQRHRLRRQKGKSERKGARVRAGGQASSSYDSSIQQWCPSQSPSRRKKEARHQQHLDS